MAEILRVKVKSQGFPGGPGWTTMHWAIETGSSGEPQLISAFDWWNTNKSAFPTLWTAQIQSPADVLDLASGEIVRVVPVPLAQQAVLTGGPSNKFGSGVAGACITWYTDVRINGRKVRGRTFLVPVAAEIWQDNGTLVQANLDEMVSSSTQLIDDANGFGIYTRPGATGGAAFSPAVAARVSDQAAFLSSRRT